MTRRRPPNSSGAGKTDLGLCMCPNPLPAWLWPRHGAMWIQHPKDKDESFEGGRMDIRLHAHVVWRL
jgi:hypothetical protein